MTVKVKASRKCFAAVDIGSNAVRLVVKSVRRNADGSFGKPEQDLLIRFPLRLGREAFTEGRISKETAKQLVHLMKAFRQMLKVFPVTAFRACATSAMRDARNGRKVAARIRRKTGLPVRIIDGEEEARLVYGMHAEREFGQEKNCMYVDVGGGSTQVSLLYGGELVFSRSFDVGTVRMLSDGGDGGDRVAMLSALTDLRGRYPAFKLVGSGGNINKLHKLLQESGGGCVLNVERLRGLKEELSRLAVDERMRRFRIKRDRAEVIGFAVDIFVAVADVLEIPDIVVPSISLSDGIIHTLVTEDEALEG
jgi:exopolyphosphatase/guanosine-5'-triphosphate,3'-diphosphate pyrophosphatase